MTGPTNILPPETVRELPMFSLVDEMLVTAMSFTLSVPPIFVFPFTFKAKALTVDPPIFKLASRIFT